MKIQKLKNTAHLSKCRRYRYALWRTWDASKSMVMFIGLNPSTADETENDPTLIRCINFAKLWGYGSVCMTNLFAYRATEPSDMKASSDPIGNRNNFWLKKIAADSGIVVAAWGNHGTHLARAEKVQKMFPELYCLKRNKSGSPAHPLYQKSNIFPQKMS